MPWILGLIFIAIVGACSSGASFGDLFMGIGGALILGLLLAGLMKGVRF